MDRIFLAITVGGLLTLVTALALIRVPTHVDIALVEARFSKQAQ
jgi:hypothetical protein